MIQQISRSRSFRLLTTLAFMLAGFAWLGAGYLRLIHWTCNIQLDPDFFSLPFWEKSVVVSIAYLLGASIIIGMSLPNIYPRRKAKVSRMAVLVLLTATTLWARPYRPDCDEVLRRMNDSGVARDAHEGWFGRIKTDEPTFGNFATMNEKVSWWGKFNKPFEYWGEPDLAASWFDPEGRPVANIKVDAQKCKLAKASLKREYFQPGIWRVDINCHDGRRLDSQYFQVGQVQKRKGEYQILHV